MYPKTKTMDTQEKLELLKHLLVFALFVALIALVISVNQ